MINFDDIPLIGQGGWNIGDRKINEQNEIAALCKGIELGMNLIDTAEMYGDGLSEILIGKVLRSFHRHEYIIVSKVYPHNAGKDRIFDSCDNSLLRLGVDYLDLYLLHWRASVPLAETVECMENLKKSGKIRQWGVSNFDVSDMRDLFSVPNGKNCFANQVMYNITSRGVEFDLIPFLAENNVMMMAYCPLAQGGRISRMVNDIKNEATLNKIAAKYKISVMQLMLAFTIRNQNTKIVAIPKAGTVAHVQENAKMLDFRIDKKDWAEIDKVFLPPSHKMHLDIE